ncbi:MAG: hypothetical protein A2284_08700 [Deltaproteobacteria bacterium RIFOXYA12_FULL_61_11]|nr:MAG: hypothetical protein A2284_08700 [Deltaproteobacteria bacterium RIFOXYA12_FULL_61_11]
MDQVGQYCPGEKTRLPSLIQAMAIMGTVSCAILLYEIALTRLCSIRLFFHFAFLILGHCMLGLGVSSILVGVFQRRILAEVLQWLQFLLLAFSASFLLVHPLLSGMELTKVQLLQPDLGSLLAFLLFNVVAMLPFFLGGGVLALVMQCRVREVHVLYGVDLLAAAAGCALAPLLLPLIGVGGLVAVASTLGAIALLASLDWSVWSMKVLGALLLVVIGGVCIPQLDHWYPVRAKKVLNLTRDASLPIESHRVYSRWSTQSRVDVIEVDESKRFMFCRGAHTLGIPLPDQRYILQDGAAGSLLLDFSRHPEALELVERSAYSAAFALVQRPRVLILGVGGGCDLWAARQAGASVIKGLELNAQVLELHRGILWEFSKRLLEDPRVELVQTDARSVLMREESRYDVIQMTGTDTWTALTSGSYVLAENYLYTVEAMRAMVGLLDAGGILSITRFARDMEGLRLLALLDAALEGSTQDFARSLVCFVHPGALLTVLYRRGGFSAADVEVLDSFFRRNGFGRLYAPGGRKPANTVLERFILAPDKEGFIAAYPRDISPTTDDRPYFFTFDTWKQGLAALFRVDEPVFVSQGNPMFVLTQAGLVLLFSALFIFLPFSLHRRKIHRTRISLGRTLGIFAGIGLGYMLVELSLIQKLVLLLGHPGYSLSVTLGGLLASSGLGCLVTRGWIATPRKTWLLLAAIVSALGMFVILDGPLVASAIALPTPVRLLVAFVAVFPLGALLGVPFAYAINALSARDPFLLPWAWAINISASVLGTVLAAMLSMAQGFDAVFLAAGLSYGLALAVLAGTLSREQALVR